MEEGEVVIEDKAVVLARAIKNVQCARNEDEEQVFLYWGKSQYVIRLNTLLDSLNKPNVDYGYEILTIDFNGEMPLSGYASDYFSTDIESSDSEKQIKLTGNSSTIIIEPLNYNSPTATDAYEYCKSLFNDNIEYANVSELSIEALKGLSLCELRNLEINLRQEAIDEIVSESIVPSVDMLLKNVINTTQDEVAMKEWYIEKIEQTNNIDKLVSFIKYIPEAWLENALSSDNIQNRVLVITNSGLNTKKYNALRKLMRSVTSQETATSLYSWLKDESSLHQELFGSLNDISSDNFKNIAIGVTHLYCLQNSENIIAEGKDVEKENFFVWNPLGNITDYNLNEIDNWEAMMDFRSNAYIATYRVLFEDNGDFIVNVQRSTLLGPQFNSFELDPFETVSVYFEVKNEHIGIEDHTVAMPGVYLAWLIETAEEEAEEAFVEFALTIATFYFPAASLSRAINAGSYMRMLWNGFLLTKTVTDRFLKDDDIRAFAKNKLGVEFMDIYGTVSKVIDVGVIYSDFAHDEYLSAITNLVQAWDNVDENDKDSFESAYPEEFQLLQNKINSFR
ncbi:hypothetical protein [Salinivirga cyanobacteriivorans]|uniref:hypothetical protein n=1 Tax=Salinivirga cyanobacteriivorans TaxID=1307839 RepID=UPI0012FDD5E2|nr:hypothetical protein [Salinivirga cyanobacteriivorans]